MRRENALFAVDDREIAVGREAERRQLLTALDIVLHARAAGLLVQTEEDAHAAAELFAGRGEGLERVQRRHHRALVVDRAAGIDPPVRDLRAVGVVRPARALRHDVEVTEHDDELLALAVIEPAAAPVEVGRPEAHLRAEAQHIVEAVLRAASERRAALAESLYAFDAQQPLQRRNFLVKMIPDPCLMIHVMYFLCI